MRGVVNVDAIFALMIFLIFFGFVSNYVLQMSGKSQSNVDLRSAREKLYFAILEDGTLLDASEQAPVVVISGDPAQDYLWLKWGQAGLSVPSVYDPVFGEVIWSANLSQGVNEYLLSNSPGNAGGDILFDGTGFSNLHISLNVTEMNLTGLMLGNNSIASAIFLAPAPEVERDSRAPLRVKVAGGNYSWGLFANHSGFVLEYEATGVSTLLNISVVLDPSLLSVYTNETSPCANFTKETDFVDAYGSRGLAVAGERFIASCSGGILSIAKTIDLTANESRTYQFRFYAHEGGYVNALGHRSLPVVVSGLPFQNKMFSPAGISGISDAYCGKIRDSVNPNLGLWLSFNRGNATYDCRTDTSSSTQDVIVSKKAFVYSDGERGTLYLRVWYK